MSLDVVVRDDLERVVQVIDALAARPHARRALIMWRLFLEDHLARAVDHDSPSPLTCEQVIDHVERISREYADVVHECRKNFDADKLALQGAELIAAVTTLVRCAEAADGNSGDSPPRPQLKRA